MTVTLPAPRCRSTAWTVTLAPPLPSTRHFFPLGSRPAWRRRLSKPRASVLSPYSVPSGRRSRVFTLPMAAAMGESSAQ